jgi:hypothetical protein
LIKILAICGGFDANRFSAEVSAMSAVSIGKKSAALWIGRKVLFQIVGVL